MTAIDSSAAQSPPTWCPSGIATAPESVVLGVRSDADGRVTYLAEPVPAAEVLGDIPADIEPTRVLRFASHCTSGCLNREGSTCRLVERVVAATPVAVSGVPRCHLRTRCQWWQQKGVAGCQRCPAVSTAYAADDALTTLVADPGTTLEQLGSWIAETA